MKKKYQQPSLVAVGIDSPDILCQSFGISGIVDGPVNVRRRGDMSGDCFDEDE